MKICVDENIPLMTIRALREMGHEVLDIRSTAHKGVVDEALWIIAQAGTCLLITTDKGFAQRRTENHHGILIVRLRQPNRHLIHQRVMQAMAQVPPGEWAGLLVVMRDRAQSLWRTGEERLKPQLPDTQP